MLDFYLLSNGESHFVAIEYKISQLFAVVYVI